MPWLIIKAHSLESLPLKFSNEKKLKSHKYEPVMVMSNKEEW